MNHRVKEIRKALGLSGEEFGQVLGITRGAVSNIENGNRKLTEQTIRLICREFNVNEDWLRTGTGEMFNETSPDEIIADVLGRVLNKNTDPFIKKIVTVLLTMVDKMTPEDWEALKQYILEENP